MKNIIVKGILDEFCNDFSINLAEDKSFESLINYLVVSRIQSEAVENTEQILSLDVDDGGTFGIDGLAIFVNDNIILGEQDLANTHSKSTQVNFVFTQSKTSINLEVSEISKFARAVQAFFKDERTIAYSNAIDEKYKLKNKIFERDFSKNLSYDSPKCALYFAYTGKYKYDKNVEEVIKQEIDNINRENPFLKDIKIVILDSDRIISMYNESINSIEIDISFKDRLSLDNIDYIEDVYYGFLKKEDFFKLVEDDEGNFRANIFYENVRDYLGDDNPVNMEIIETLKSDTQRQYFAVLNNGITVITRYIKPISSSRLIIKDYQIVNGCQTSNVLYKCKEYIKNDELSIPIKIIYTTNSGIINRIIRANNKQSVVPEEAFYALGEYHKNLQEFFRQKSKNVSLPIYYERRSREISNDTELKISREQIISLHAQIRALTSVYYNNPHLVYSNNPNFILKMKFSFFEEDHNYAAYYAGNYIIANIRKQIKQKKIANKYHWFVYYIAMYFRIIVTGHFNSIQLNNKKIENEANNIIKVIDNHKEMTRIINIITSLIDIALSKIQSIDKYQKMSYGQIAALTIFEEELEKVFKTQNKLIKQ